MIVLLSVVAPALLCKSLVCRFLLLSLPVMPMMTVNGKFRFLSTGFYTGTRHRCRVADEDFNL
jgi:hypothetical protein